MGSSGLVKDQGKSVLILYERTQKVLEVDKVLDLLKKALYRRSKSFKVGVKKDNKDRVEVNVN